MERVGPFSDAYWNTVCNADWHDPYDEGDVEEAVSHIRELRCAENKLPSPSGELKTTLVARQLELEPLVLALREKLFGSIDPPFASSDAAGAWIRATVREETGIPLSPTESMGPRVFSWATVSYDSGGRISHMDSPFPTAPGGKLSEIAYLSERIASSLQCSPGQAARFILIGDIPKTSPIAVHTIFGSHPATSSLVITIRSPSVTAKELANRYKDLREVLWGSKRARHDSPVDLKLLELCMNMPDASWEERHRAWNCQYPGDSFEKQDTFRTRCNRFQNKRWRPRKR